MAETSTNAQENKQRRVTDWENYHPLPMHRHIGSYKLFVSLLIVAYLLIGIGLTLFPETAVTLSTNGLMLPIALPIIPVVVWLVWSYVVHDRYIHTDPNTGHQYAIDDKGLLVFDGGDQCLNDCVDAENRVISRINATDIPHVISDGECITVRCLDLIPDTTHLVIDYPKRYDIRESLDSALAAAYPEGSIQADTVLLGDDRISAGYTIRHDGEVGDTSH